MLLSRPTVIWLSKKSDLTKCTNWKVAGRPHVHERQAHRQIPSLWAAASASCVARASPGGWPSVWEMGIYPPFDTSGARIGENGSAASALAHLASCASLSHVSSLRS